MANMIFKVYLALRRWMLGTFTCIRCGRNFRLQSFGYGKVICPECYRREQPWIFFEDSIMRRLIR